MHPSRFPLTEMSRVIRLATYPTTCTTYCMQPPGASRSATELASRDGHRQRARAVIEAEDSRIDRRERLAQVLHLRR